MGVVKGRYEIIGPRAEFLTDTVILAQAWKKSHRYIRRHNWYADVLELDCSAVQLDTYLNEWAEDLKSGSYVPRPLRLIPAPKSRVWEIGRSHSPGWGPVESDTPRVLRPLAHLVLLRSRQLSMASGMVPSMSFAQIYGLSSQKFPSLQSPR